MAAVRAAFDRGLGSGLWTLFKEFNPLTLIAETLNGLSKWLFDFDLFEAGNRLLQRLIDGIKSLLPDFDAILAPVRNAWSWASNQFGPSARANAAAFGPDAASIVSGGPSLPVPPSPGSPAAMAVMQAPPVNNQVSVVVQRAGPEATASVSSSGGSTVRTDVGYSMDGGIPY
jgi:hypothetical protein